MAFVVVTGVLYMMNLKFKNIWHFDFTDTVDTLTTVDSLHLPVDTNSSYSFLDSTHVHVFQDTLIAEKIIDSTIIKRLLDSLESVHEIAAGLSAELDIKETEIENYKKAVIEKKDSAYADWKKETVKLYNKMDPKLAAQIIQSYSDDVARDILYSIKKKKAVEILANLNSEHATRLTRNQ